MSSFALLRVGGSAPIDIERVDLNLWVLPSLFRRQVYYCDIGVCCKIKQTTQEKPIKLELRVPFLPDDDDAEDLVPRMRDNDGLCSLIFGNSNLNMNRNKLGTWVSDHSGPLLLTDLDIERKKAPGADTRAASWMLSTEPVTLSADTRLYVRIRVTTHEPNRLWVWQRGGRWNSHALCDLRINEFREKRKSDFPIDFSKVITLPRVNGFVISSARYKAGRVNPIPEYIRVLENDSWAEYLGRRLSRGRELFLITCWKDVDVSPEHPYRAFMEMERRRPTATRAIVATTLLLLLVILAGQPIASVAQSPLGRFAGHLWGLGALAVGTVSLGVLWSISKFTLNQVNSGNFNKARKLLKKIEQHWYRTP